MSNANLLTEATLSRMRDENREGCMDWQRIVRPSDAI